MTNPGTYPRTPEARINPVNPVEVPDLNLPPLPEHAVHTQLRELSQGLGPLQKARQRLQGLKANDAEYLHQMIHVDKRHPADAQQILDNRPEMQEAITAYKAAEQAVMAYALGMMSNGDPRPVIGFFHDLGQANKLAEQANIKDTRKTGKHLVNKGQEAATANLANDNAQLAHRLGVDIGEQTLKDYRESAVSATYKARRAKEKHAVQSRQTERSQGWGDTLTTVGDLLQGKYEQQLQLCQSELGTVSQFLDRQTHITHPIDRATAHNVHNHLTQISAQINKLSHRDPARAELVKTANQLTYRLIQREINTGVVNSADIEASFTEDGGLLINKGTPAEKVLYDNGDVGQFIFDAHGRGHYRRSTPEGSVRLSSEIQPIQALPEDPKNPRRRDSFPAKDLARWDKFRTPETMVKAHAELRDFTRTLEGYEKQASKQYKHAWGERVKIDHFILSTKSQINQLHNERTNADNHRMMLEANINATHPNDPRRANLITSHNQVLAAINNLNTSLSTARYQLHNAGQHKLNNKRILDNTDNQLRRIREDLGPGRYWQGVLESRMTPPKPHRKKGFVALMGKIKAKPEEITPSPDMLADGTVVWSNHAAHPNDNRTLPYTSKMGAWRYRADGRNRQVA
ncbi:MAG TPA: hypothetical protein VF733_02935 [Candidatus Saccharimonadales bacterium]